EGAIVVLARLGPAGQRDAEGEQATDQALAGGQGHQYASPAGGAAGWLAWFWISSVTVADSRISSRRRAVYSAGGSSPRRNCSSSISRSISLRRSMST